MRIFLKLCVVTLLGLASQITVADGWTKQLIRYGLGYIELQDRAGQCFVSVSGMQKFEPGFLLDVGYPCYVINIVKDTSSEGAISLGKGRILLTVVGGVDKGNGCGNDLQGIDLSLVSIKKIQKNEKLLSLKNDQIRGGINGVCVKDGLNKESLWYRALWGDSL